jgi:hypothetical protein
MKLYEWYLGLLGTKQISEEQFLKNMIELRDTMVAELSLINDYINNTKRPKEQHET